MRLLIPILIFITFQPGLSQNDREFKKALESYFKNNKVDSIEGLYTISDDLLIIPPWYEIFSSKEQSFRDHWAKVAIIRDSTSLTRDYYELIIESPYFKEREMRAEFLRTKQNALIFVSKQLSIDKAIVESMMFEYIPDGEMLVTTYERLNGDYTHKLKRTYLKYYPRK